MTNQEPQPGDRVYALLDMNENNARLLGYGVYEGEFAAPGSESFEQFWSGQLEEWKEGVLKDATLEELKERYAKNPFLNNPRIKLDSGHTVWGCQCWWGPEEELKVQESKLNIVQVNMDEWLSSVAANDELLSIFYCIKPIGKKMTRPFTMEGDDLELSPPQQL